MSVTSTSLASHAATTADQPYLHLLEGVEFTPIFVLGFARSGTTLLYELLTRTGAFNFFNFYHIANYPDLLNNYINHREAEAYQALDQHLADLGIRDRGFDGITITTKAPLEYRLIRESGAFTSLPRQIWQVLQKAFQPRQTALFFSQDILTPKTLPLFTQACKKLQFISGNAHPLLLKNPWDFPNFIFLKEHFPQAKFIFIHRHPANVINSQLRALRDLLTEKNPYISQFFPVYNELFEQPFSLALLKSFLFSPFWAWLRVNAFCHLRSQAAAYYLENIGSLPPSDYISLRYEDLCTQPDQTRAMILEFLGQNSEGSWQELIKPRPQSLLPELEARYAGIQQKFLPYLTHLHYELRS